MQKPGWPFLGTDRLFKIEWTAFRSTMKSNRSSRSTDHHRAFRLALAGRLPTILPVTSTSNTSHELTQSLAKMHDRNGVPCPTTANAEIRSRDKGKKLSTTEASFLSEAIRPDLVQKQMQRIRHRKRNAYKGNLKNFESGTRFAFAFVLSDSWSLCGFISQADPRHLEWNLKCVALRA